MAVSVLPSPRFVTRNFNDLYRRVLKGNCGQIFLDLHLRTDGGSRAPAPTTTPLKYSVPPVIADPQKRIYLLDVWRRQTSRDQWIDAFCDLALKWKPLQWAEEQGQISAGIGPFLDQRTRERQAHVYREQFPTRGDKARRAQSIRGRMALDGLYVPERAPWYANFRAELLNFPAGNHDDQVDALGLIGQLLNKMVIGRPAAKPEETHRSATRRMRVATI